MPTIDFGDLSGVINPIYLDKMIFNDNPIQIYYGGSSSGKSHAIAQRTILDVLSGRNYLIVRKTGDSIRRSTFNEIVSKLYDLKVQNYFSINKAEMIVQCKLNNRQIIFKGLDDVEKLKSIKPLSGVITDIWLEEATECSYNDYKQLDKRLRGETHFTKRITFSFNPIVRSHWIYETFFKGVWDNTQQYVEKDGVSILKTTYRDNYFLTVDDIARLESEKDPYYRMVYLNGDWGILSGAVFTDWEVAPFRTDRFDQYRVGVDWGFADDPFACIRSAIVLRERVVYVCDEIYGRGLLNDTTIPLVKKLAHGSMVWCDNAEPKSIAEYRANGINAYAVKKGHGSIEQGINFMKRFHIVIHPSCKHTADEFSSYRYKNDPKTGDTLPDIVDKDNHCVALGTLVTTARGQVPIEYVVVGDMILTRKGWRECLYSEKQSDSAPVLLLITKRGKTLMLTKDHAVWTDLGWVDAGLLRVGDRVSTNMPLDRPTEKHYSNYDEIISIEQLFQKMPVYDLTVSGRHEFYANTILVANCIDAMRYSLSRDVTMRGTIKDSL